MKVELLYVNKNDDSIFYPEKEVAIEVDKIPAENVIPVYVLTYNDGDYIYHNASPDPVIEKNTENKRRLFKNIKRIGC